MSEEAEIVARLRAILKQRKVKLTEAAVKLNVPYRSLQNYVQGRTSMPVGIFFKLCSLAGVPADYLRDEKFKIGHHELSRALRDVMGAALPVCTLEEFEFVVRVPTVDQMADLQSANNLSHLIARRYDMLCEAELRQHIVDEDDEVPQ